MIAALLIALIVLGLPTLYFAWRSREFRKFLEGAFFVSAGIQFYLYLANVSVPLLGTNLVLTPEISGVRSIVHSSCSGFAFTLALSKSQKAQASNRAVTNEYVSGRRCSDERVIPVSGPPNGSESRSKPFHKNPVRCIDS
jgi:hypothetical protein